MKSVNGSTHVLFYVRCLASKPITTTQEAALLLVLEGGLCKAAVVLGSLGAVLNHDRLLVRVKDPDLSRRSKP